LNIEIIAELAQGFEGSLKQSQLLMKAASAAGADAAKYQLVYADELATPDYKYYELFKTLEMTDKEWTDLSEYARELDVKLYLDIFGSHSLRLAEEIGASAIKLHGTDITNIGLLNEVAESSMRKVILGAGGGYVHELQQALEILQSKQVVVLLGYQGYPTPDETNQIARVSYLRESIGKNFNNVTFGFADHAVPDSPLRYAFAATAIGAGAKVLEKHLTLGQIMKMEDHESALNPDQFYEFVRIIRACDTAIGIVNEVEDYGMSESEKDYRKMIRRHVVTNRDIGKGTKIEPSDLVLKRSSAEDILTDLNDAYDKVLKNDLKKNSPISPSDIE